MAKADVTPFKPTKPVALITGGSSGIGFELAKEFSAHNYNLILVASDETKLEKAAKKLRAMDKSSQVEIIVADLESWESPEQIYKAVKKLKMPVDILVNNAGHGVYGDFATQTDVELELAMIQVNVSSLVHLTKLFVKDMVTRGSGRILFTASVASLSGTPLLTTYAATKAFVYSFAEGLRDELKDKGITVTALLPGATDTNFFKRAGMQKTKTANSDLADPAEVAHAGFEALMAGDDHVVAPLKTRVGAALSKFLPDELAAKMARAK